MKSRFDKLYENSRSSGNGSEPYAIINFNNIITNIIQNYNIHSILDLACGNCNSMKICINDLSINYTGADISEKIINSNKNIYPNINFLTLNAVNCDLTKFNQDLIVFRHVIQHLNFNDAQTAIKNIFNSKCKYLLINHQCGLRSNKDEKFIEVGWNNQLYNLNLEPFNLKSKEVFNMIDLDAYSHKRYSKEHLDQRKESYSLYKIN